MELLCRRRGVVAGRWTSTWNDGSLEASSASCRVTDAECEFLPLARWLVVELAATVPQQTIEWEIYERASGWKTIAQRAIVQAATVRATPEH